jgi:MFS family permease
MVPVGMAMVGDIYPMGKRARPLGVIAAVDTAGWVVGHLYGGIVVRYLDWRMIFWLNLPLCLIAYVIIWYMLKGVAQERSKGSMDWLGAVLITISLSVLNIGLGSNSDSTTTTLGTQYGLPAYAIPLILTAVVFLALFIWRQKRTKYPLVDLSLFRRQNYMPASVANFLVGFSLFIAIANVPLFINSLIATTLEQGAWDSGWMLCALTIPMAIASVPGGWLTDQRGYRLPAMIGLVIAVFGFAWMTGWEVETPYTTMASHLVFGGVGIGLTMAPIAAAVVNASPPDQRGTSSALVIIFRLVGMTIGVSSITTYGLLRAEVLGERMLSEGASLYEIGRVGMEVTERVISETFMIAGIIAALAFVPTLFLKTIKTSEVSDE